MRARVRIYAVFTALADTSRLTWSARTVQPGFMLRNLRDADWLDGARATGYLRILLGITIAARVGLIALSPNGIDLRGEPLGTDFAAFWTASKLALSGTPEKAYDATAHYALQLETFGARTGFYVFFYPPIYL